MRIARSSASCHASSSHGAESRSLRYPAGDRCVPGREKTEGFRTVAVPAPGRVRCDVQGGERPTRMLTISSLSRLAAASHSLPLRLGASSRIGGKHTSHRTAGSTTQSWRQKEILRPRGGHRHVGRQLQAMGARHLGAPREWPGRVATFGGCCSVRGRAECHGRAVLTESLSAI
jgi:hypothetical protein